MGNIHICRVSKAFASGTVLDEYSAVLEEGKIYALMAPSGAGKTTLLRILAGLEQPDDGAVEGTDPGGISMMFQDDRLLEQYSAFENVLFASPGLSGPQIREALEETGLGDSQDRPVSELSGGMRRRTALVRALMHPGKLLLLDEPFTGLDEEARGNAIRMLLKRSAGRTVLFTTHREDEALACSASVLTFPWHRKPEEETMQDRHPEECQVSK